MLACGLGHGVRVVHLHANHLGLRAHRLEVVGHAGNQPAAANGNEHRVEPVAAQCLQLAQHFHGNRALAGDHVGVVEGVDEGQALLLLQLHGMAVGVGIAVPMQQHLAALAYRTQAPLIDSLLNEIGLSGGSLSALADPLKNSPQPVEKTTEE